jgi:fructose-bisphosphate aldolase class I
MTNAKMTEQMRQAGALSRPLTSQAGRPPKALKQYGVSESEYSGEEQMFDLIHAMRSRIIKSPAFTGDKVVGAILFEQTMDRVIDGIPTPPTCGKSGGGAFLKIDKGLEAEADGVS